MTNTFNITPFFLGQKFYSYKKLLVAKPQYEKQTGLTLVQEDSCLITTKLSKTRIPKVISPDYYNKLVYTKLKLTCEFSSTRREHEKHPDTHSLEKLLPFFNLF